MNSERYADYRTKWLANRRAEKLEPAKRALRKVAETMEQDNDVPGRVHLTREQFDAIRDAVLKGITAYASEDPVNSRRFKILRDTWSNLAPVQGKQRCVIEVEREDNPWQNKSPHG